MRRCLLILAGVIITAVYTVYMLGAMSCSPRALASLWPNQKKPAADDNYSLEAGTSEGIQKTAPAQKKNFRPVDGWELIWADEFAEPMLDSTKWTAVERENNYNNELQYYSPLNVFLRDGCLYLTANQEKKGGKVYTSAMVQTLDKFSCQYGKLEARLKLPTGKGLFPGFWLLANASKNEIDIMEMIGNEPEVIYGVVHSFSGELPTKQYGFTIVEHPADFHLYTLEWEERELRWYVDGELFFLSSMVPREEMYIILTLAVGGDWPGTPNRSTVFPCSLVIDYLRIFQRWRGEEAGHVALD